MHTKIALTFKDEEGNIGTETIWAEDLGEGRFKVDNIPFFALNIAVNDIIAAEEEDGILHFEQILEASGHSTLQIIFFQPDQSSGVLARLEALGCAWEGMKNQPYYSVDIPVSVDYSLVKNLLKEYCQKDILDYREACLSLVHYKG
jgi:hypothetical protein